MKINKKNIFQIFMALVLAAVMILAAVPQTAMAAEATDIE